VALKSNNLILAAGEQPPQPEENPSNLAKAGLGAAAVGAAGFLPIGQRRLWDYYLSGIRGVEAGFPAAILRTFRVSEALSPFESWSRFDLSPTEIRSSTIYGEYLRRFLGESTLSAAITKKKGIFGEITNQEGQRIGLAASITSGTQRSETIADYYARLAGVPVDEKLSIREGVLRARYEALSPGVPYDEWLKNLSFSEKQPRVPLIAPYRSEVKLFGKTLKLNPSAQKYLAKAEILQRYISAKAATTMGRLNTLLRKPFEVPGIGKILSKIPVVRGMGGKPSSAAGMMGGYVRKGLLAGGALTALSYYDYLRSEGGAASVVGGPLLGGVLGGLTGIKHGRPISTKGAAIGAIGGLAVALSPRFDEGLFHGALSMVTDLNVARAELSQKLGLQKAVRRQEEITPGLLSIKTGLGFAGVGALGAGFVGYGSLLQAAAKEKIATNKPFEEIFSRLRSDWYGEGDEVGKAGRWIRQNIGRRLEKIPVVGKRLAKVKSPMAMGAIGGAGLWLASTVALPLLSGNIGAAIPGANLLATEETPEELRAIYSGEKEIPVRKGRFWEMGRSTSYEGGRVQYYRKHALERLRTRAFQKGLWGEEEEKWEHHPLLNPLKAVLGSDEWKYYYDIKHQYDRPAPLTSTYGENIPFVGPLVAATFGKLLKPRKYVRPEEWMAKGDLQEGVIYPPGESEERPAYELGGLSPGMPVAPEEASQLYNELIYRRREAVGLIGFAEGALQEAITGREEYFPNKETLATMGEGTSSEYWLWEHLNLGGALGLSEPIRRFIPHERRYLQEYNPLERQAAPWMPDNYFVDLKTGNPLEEIPEAETRLAGSGYAALHPEVEGLSPEEYPLAHRVKILGDVAFWSPEYRQIAKQARSRISSLSPEHQKMVQETFNQVREKKRRRSFDEYQFRSEELSEMMLTVSRVLSPREVLTEELGPMKVSLQGVGAVRGDMREAMATAEEALLGKRIPVATPALEGRRYDIVGAGPRMKGVAMLGDTDYGTWMAEQGITEPSLLEDEFRQLRFGTTERLAGGIWENLTRAAETPLEALTPLSPASKLIRQRSAIEEYEKTEAIGTEASFWNEPLANFLLPAMEEMEYALGDEEIPGPVQQKRAIQEYFDILKWEKYRRLAETADTKQARAAAMAQQGRTLFGADPFKRPGAVMSAMPRSTRDFFQAFSEAKTEEDRERILSLVSQQEKRIYLAQWMSQQQVALEAKRRARIATRQEAVTLNKILMARQAGGYGFSESDLEQWRSETGEEVSFDDWLREKKAQEYFDTHSLPGADWIGWHSSCDLEDVQARYLQHEGMDHHDFDIWGDRMRSLARKPYVSTEVIGRLTPTERLSQEEMLKPGLMQRNMRILQESFGAKDARIEISNIGASGISRYNIDIKDERASLVDRTMKEIGV